MITLHMKSSAVWRRHGPVRLNGTEDASYSRGQGNGVGKDGWTENGPPLCADRTQAKRAGLDQASGLNASACQRSEGTKEAHQARDSRREAQCAARQRVCPGPAQRKPSQGRRPRPQAPTACSP